ncbi:putative receptor-like protein kinase [Iris pallida]|uniref:Receptor-like protein kinase n=1 Tax=Iris pallida TaxID=29817 RepID=A0AAX6EJJ2_IRIPA|nr:putative receptor-like protein kinase [Iris pallida]
MFMHLYSQATNPYSSSWHCSCCMHFYSQRHLPLQHYRTTPPTSHPCSLSKPLSLVVVMLLLTTSSQQTGPRTPPSAPGLASAAADVGCSRRRPRVISLNLSSFFLQGTISLHLFDLSFLSSLDLSNNSLSGTILKTLGRLPRLVTLILQ